jgi:hypothetical protein
MNTATEEDADTQGHTFHSSTLPYRRHCNAEKNTGHLALDQTHSSHHMLSVVSHLQTRNSKNITLTIDDCHGHTVFEPRLNWMYLNGTTWSIRLEPHVVRLENHGLPPRCCLSVAFLPNGARRPNRLQSPRHHRKDRWLPPRRCLRNPDRALLNGTRQSNRHWVCFCNCHFLRGMLQTDPHCDREYHLKKRRIPWRYSRQLIR